MTIRSRNDNILTSFDYTKAYQLTQNPSTTGNQLRTTVDYSDAPNQTSVTTFDGLGRPLNTILNGVVKNEIIYDNLGRIEQQTYLPGNFTTLEYDNSPLNRVIKETYPDNTFTTQNFSRLNNYYLVASTDENGQITRTTTDILGRTYQIFDAENGLLQPTTYLYEDDRHNKPTRIVPPMGDVGVENPLFDYKYTFDSRNRLATKAIPQGGTMGYTYEEATDLLQTVTDANTNTLTYSYDVYGRETLTELHTSGNPDKITLNTNTYDVGGGINIGKMTKSAVRVLGTDNLLVTDYVYDSFGRLAQNTTQNHINGQDMTTFTYNHADWTTTTLRQHTGYENLSIRHGL